MPNIVIRHLSGTKANQVEEVPLQGFREVLIGRDSNAHVRFDADREDLVSRNHARVVRDPADPNGFLLMDLDSRNGTFINRQRIYGASRLQHGDRVQLGPSGPEFAFELDPPPIARATRLADSIPAPPTREAAVAASVSSTAVPPGMTDTRQSATGHRPIGRETVERMLGDVSTQMKGESRKTMWTAVIGILVVLVAGAGYFVWDRQQKSLEAEKTAAMARQMESQVAASRAAQAELVASINKFRNSKSPEDQKKLVEAQKALEETTAKLKADEAELTKVRAGIATTAGGAAAAGAGGTGGSGTPPGNMPDVTPEAVHAANTKSVILIENTWKITDAQTGSQIHIFNMQNAKGYCPEVSKSEYLPVFVQDDPKRAVDPQHHSELKPVLSTLLNDGHNAPVVATISGTGFIVGGEGFFLTNRHVLAPWRSSWNTADFAHKPMGIKIKDKTVVGCIPASDFPSAWIPSEGSPWVVDQKDADKINVSGRLESTSSHTSVVGEAVYNATFAKTMQRYRATSVTLSEKHDVALGKVDLPGGGKAVMMFTDQDAIRPGQPVVVMGYPAISPTVFGVDVSRDMFTSRAHISAIADPTLTTGPISKVIATGTAISGADGTISEGEIYQLGINTTGAGNSGGPVFDSKGRVIAVFYAGATRGGASVTYAVPIKFGKELIDNPSAIK